MASYSQIFQGYPQQYGSSTPYDLNLLYQDQLQNSLKSDPCKSNTKCYTPFYANLKEYSFEQNFYSRELHESELRQIFHHEKDKWQAEQVICP